MLLAGLGLIVKKRLRAHAVVMTCAFAVSCLFLVSYLYYHARHGATRFPAAGWPRTIYLAILISHTILAILVVPLSIRTLYLGFKDRVPAHRQIARWAFPVWLYVSVTGVVVYWMLYRMRWP